MNQETEIPPGDFVAYDGGERRRDPRVGVSSPLAEKVLSQGPVMGDVQPTEIARPEPPRPNSSLDLEAILLSAAGRPAIPIKVSNVSRKGMGFYCQRALRRGDRFAVRFRFVNAADRMVLCTVCFCQPLAGEWCQGGAEFITAVTSDKQLAVVPQAWLQM